MEIIAACTIIILGCLYFFYKCLRLYGEGKIGGTYSLRQKFLDCIEQIKKTSRWRDYFFIFSVSFVFLFRGVLGVFIAAVAGVVSTVIIGASPCVSEETLFSEASRYIWETIFKPRIETLRPEEQAFLCQPQPSPGTSLVGVQNPSK